MNQGENYCVYSAHHHHHSVVSHSNMIQYTLNLTRATSVLGVLTLNLCTLMTQTIVIILTVTYLLSLHDLLNINCFLI